MVKLFEYNQFNDLRAPFCFILSSLHFATTDIYLLPSNAPSRLLRCSSV